MSDFWRNTVTEREPDSKKLHLTWDRARKICFHLWRQFDDPYYTGFAAQLAYFFMMSTIPMLIVLTQLLGIFDISMDFIREWLEAHLSTQMGSVLENVFSASSTSVSNFLMIVLAVWASSSLAFNLSRLTTYTLSYGRYRYNFFTERLKAIPMALITILVVALALVVYVYGELIAKSLLRSPFLYELVSSVRTPLLFLVLYVMILASYYVLPRIRVPVRAVLPGAVLATIGIMIVTWFYSLYISRATNYNLLYGAFSNIVAMMLWFYLISWVLCIGMMFNKSWDIHMRRGRLTPAKIKEYLMRQYGDKGEEMWNRLIIGDYDMADRSLDSLAVKMSRRFDPGYEEKREREIAELIEERMIREQIEQEIMDRAEDPEEYEYPYDNEYEDEYEDEDRNIEGGLK